MAQITFKRRLKLFSIGVGIGIILSIFFFYNKGDAITGWLPEERVLKRLRETERKTTEPAKCQMKCLDITNAQVDSMLTDGDVDFGESDPQAEPKKYVVRSSDEPVSLQLRFEVEGETHSILEVMVPDPSGCTCP